jgi:hypothetical protein
MAMVNGGGSVPITGAFLNFQVTAADGALPILTLCQLVKSLGLQPVSGFDQSR